MGRDKHRKKTGGVRANEERQAPGHRGPGSTQSRRQRGRERGGGKRGEEANADKKKGHGKPQPGRSQKKKKDKTATEKVRRTKTCPGGEPARPGQEVHAQADTRGTRRWRPPTRKGRCGRPQETAPVHRQSPLSRHGRYGKPDASVTGSTHAKPPQRTQRKTEAGGTQQGQPEGGPRTGTTRSKPSSPASAGASGRHKDPGSRPASLFPAQPPSKAGGDRLRCGGRHYGNGKADRSTSSGRGAAHQRGATRHTKEAHGRPQPRHTDRCQATTATRCRKTGERAQRTTNRGTG